MILPYGCAPVQAPAAGSASDAPVRLLFDTDMDTDCDDACALGTLHALADDGEVEILATLVSSRFEWPASAVDVINTYYGRPQLSIGVPKGARAVAPWRRPGWGRALQTLTLHPRLPRGSTP